MSICTSIYVEAAKIRCALHFRQRQMFSPTEKSARSTTGPTDLNINTGLLHQAPAFGHALECGDGQHRWLASGLHTKPDYAARGSMQRKQGLLTESPRCTRHSTTVVCANPQL